MDPMSVETAPQVLGVLQHTQRCLDISRDLHTTLLRFGANRRCLEARGVSQEETAGRSQLLRSTAQVFLWSLQRFTYSGALFQEGEGSSFLFVLFLFLCSRLIDEQPPCWLSTHAVSDLLYIKCTGIRNRISLARREFLRSSTGLGEYPRSQED
ncbi:hypothetical protein BKA82DRAFT_527440 [Pisolithus tinctorius]|uniref:Uncharacterized protein n=1 Tax=Pisolithus tinctorius Marx 270 TaxID=870435 RepID=A0A0C3J8U5_PISTI|nr:hypothetical protein BKA82DRAFT_527440 [Pisolithus tinctorius]KIO05453.1 hypothetical protein M404DRAFT_527440 [Pisolithus tinctorius Marx 270]